MSLKNIKKTLVIGFGFLSASVMGIDQSMATELKKISTIQQNNFVEQADFSPEYKKQLKINENDTVQFVMDQEYQDLLSQGLMGNAVIVEQKILPLTEQVKNIKNTQFANIDLSESLKKITDFNGIHEIIFKNINIINEQTLKETEYILNQKTGNQVTGKQLYVFSKLLQAKANLIEKQFGQDFIMTELLHMSADFSAKQLDENIQLSTSELNRFTEIVGKSLQQIDEMTATSIFLAEKGLQPLYIPDLKIETNETKLSM